MLKNTTRIFAGYDASHYTLPERLVQLRDAVLRLAKLPQPVEPPHPDNLWPELVQQAAVEFTAGSPLMDASKRMAAARAAVVAFQEQSHLRAEVERRLDQALDGGVIGSADEVIREHLQPALVPVRDAMETAAKFLPEHLSTADMMSADDKSRAAWVRLDQAAAAYNALRTAWGVYGQQTECDQKGEFVEFANLTDFWPSFGKTNVQIVSSAPWPTTNTTERLLWLAHNRAWLILPTPAERDALWWAKYGAGVEAQQRSRDNIAGYRALGAA